MSHQALRGVRTRAGHAARRQVTGLRRAIEVLIETRDPVQARYRRQLCGREELPELPAGGVPGRPNRHGVADRAQRGRGVLANGAVRDQITNARPIAGPRISMIETVRVRLRNALRMPLSATLTVSPASFEGLCARGGLCSCPGV